jgi:hypothetical protein
VYYTRIEKSGLQLRPLKAQGPVLRLQQAPWDALILPLKKLKYPSTKGIGRSLAAVKEAILLSSSSWGRLKSLLRIQGYQKFNLLS